MAGILRKIFIDVELLNHINSSPVEIRTGVYNTDSEKTCMWYLKNSHTDGR